MTVAGRYEIAAPDVISETLDGEVLIVNLATGVYFRGDSEAARVWQALISGVQPDRLRATDEAQVQDFVALLIENGLIRPSDGEPLADAVDLGEVSLRLERFDDLQDMLALDPIHDVDSALGWPHTP